MAIPITIKELSYSTAAATVVVNAEERQIAVSLWICSQTSSRQPPELAPRVRVDQAVVDSALERWPGIFRDDQNQVVGFWVSRSRPWPIVSTPKAEADSRLACSRPLPHLPCDRACGAR